MRILVSGNTKTVACVSARHRDHCGILITPSNRNSVGSVVKTGLPWAVDNGAFSGFDPDAFRKLLRRVAGKPRLLWVVAPDVVADAKGTLAHWPWWAAAIRSHGLPAAFVLQDGQEECELPDADAYFIGGSTRWKLSQHAADLAAEARRRGKWLHMGRVNSLRRLRAAFDMGCDSVDGSGYSRFAAVAKSKGRGDMMLERHIRFVQSLEPQPVLFG